MAKKYIGSLEEPYFSVEMKRQVWFRTDLGYHATKNRLLQHFRSSIVGDMRDNRGRLTFQLKDFKDVTIQVTNRGKLGITYPEQMNYQLLLPQLKNLLVRPDGTQAEIIGRSRELFGSVEEGKVAETVKHLWQILFRPPTPKEIAVETGITPEVAEKLAYKTAKKTGWFHPSHELINECTEKLGEVLVCAARMRDGKPDDWHELYEDEDGPQIKKEAERVLKKFPNILPQLTEDGEDVACWPPEAIKRLGKEYKPKDRSSPELWVVPR